VAALAGALDSAAAALAGRPAFFLAGVSAAARSASAASFNWAALDLGADTEEAFLSVFGADLLADWTGLADFEAGMQKPQFNKKTGKQIRHQLRHAMGEVGGKTG
jgi:hypothetical protein